MDIKPEEKQVFHRGISLISRTVNGGNKEYYYFNVHKDTSILSDKYGDALNKYSYDAFGTQIQEPNETDNNPFRYCGEYFDNETGFVYLRARYYDPNIGRFTTEDPAKQNTNWYIYCANNPIMLFDPTGMIYIIAWSYGVDDNKNGINDLDEYKNSNGNIDWSKFTSENSFARAAYTRKQDLIAAGIPENEIDVQRIDSVEDLKATWRMWAGYDKVDGLNVYGHGSKTSGLVTPDAASSTAFWNDKDLLTLSWSNSATAVFHGCNTAKGKNSIAQKFAKKQRVETYGQQGYASFSHDVYNKVNITDRATSLNVYLYHFEYTLKGRKNINWRGRGFDIYGNEM